MKKITEYEFFKNLIKLPFVDAIWLYGSRARGDAKERSDIDIAVVCPAATEKDWLVVMDVIGNADTLLKIDCVRFDDLSEADALLKKNILREKLVLFERKI